MSYVTWEQKFELGIGSIDGDHKKLVSIMDELLVALSQGKGRDVVEPTIKKLEDYTLFHFRREEFFLKCAKYSELEGHTVEHSRFVERLKELKTKNQQQDSTVAIELMKFLKDWLINHIQVTDRKYEALLKKSGVQ